MAEHFEDQLTGEVYSTHDLDAQYRAYVADLTDELPGVQPCLVDANGKRLYPVRRLEGLAEGRGEVA